jgi:hypothetical protein
MGVDHTALDYSGDNRIDVDHPGGWISVRHGRDTSWSTFRWVHAEADETFTVLDEQENVVAAGYTSAEEAIHSVIGDPQP